MSDLISRAAALSALNGCTDIYLNNLPPTIYKGDAIIAIKALPPAQPDRDIPKKPNETTDRTWGIPKRQAVCPNCDSYLGVINFLSENGKTKVTYCESCGQAIDWKGWDFDE